MIILPNEVQNTNDTALVHPYTPEFRIRLGEERPGLKNYIMPERNNESYKIIPVITHDKTTDMRWLSIAERVDDDNLIIRFINQKPYKLYSYVEDQGEKFVSQLGRVMNWFGEYIYYFLVNRHDIGFKNDKVIDVYNQLPVKVVTLNPFFDVIAEFCHERKINVPVFDGRKFEDGVVLKPKISVVFYALFAGIKTRVMLKAGVSFNSENGPSFGFNSNRVYTISPAVGVDNLDQNYRLHIVEPGFGSNELSLLNQDIVKAWLKAVVERI